VLLTLLSCAQILQLEYALSPDIEELLIDESEIREPPLAYSPEKVMYQQQRLVEEALKTANQRRHRSAVANSRMEKTD